ncbi:TPA: tyrosine-type recombinase/integrase [Klebsiella variicola]|nr:integrase [Klebsiella michiganensis]ELC6455191.1 tyrosine-type recombinase/integrase [Enterobacter hormaechei]ELJ2664279.1 tyrosine-type recombinase/integrase [Citrobacter koseri]MBZ7589321.1 tyrosine-type recombinase/integrase [Klebsiella oxytoca]SYT95640.1 gp27 [Klebsiella pneumoniae]HBV6394754.1 tyrosine-type recombinase/integrase [Klebsiella aerogenes]HCT8863675.1 tyrosine-type recombinase/integrase [Klebsiella variicola]
MLRHTFASHFMMNGGKILVLQRIIGHSNIRETMRYSHSSPEHLKDAVLFNPLANYHGNIDENEEFNDWSSKYFH